jgi:hypothetical protein
MRGMLVLSKRKVVLPALFLLFLLGGTLSAQEVLDVPALIGLTLEEVYRSLGAPAEVYALRGETPEQDDVVFYYPSHVYLFWFENRVWQVRLDGRFSGEVFSFSMGISRQQAIAKLGRPILQFPDSLVFHIEDRGYPIQARLYFDEGGLVDLYCFRGDL